MSVQFGRWNFDGSPADRAFIQHAANITAKYAGDGETIVVGGPLGLFFQPFHTTKESFHERQPLMNTSGVTLTWDGRLDNRDELISLLGLTRDDLHTDADLVLAVYERWDATGFAKLIGDWALALWDANKHALFLAKDFLGARPLFYTLEANRVTWCTVLDPLVLLSERTLQISECFVAGHLSGFPASDLTPYVGINSVPASKFLQIDGKCLQTKEYWRFDPSNCIHHRTDHDYERHFRHIFATAVRRRLRAASPVLAELSGGMDSSSIVCMADRLMARGNAEAPRLDTVSYYDDEEPNWNERPYFSLVENRRGRGGHHINTGDMQGALLPPDRDFFFPLPGYDQLRLARSRELNNCLKTSTSRVLLSGTGGDEFLGGVPTPIPELRDLFARFHWIGFVRQLWKFSLLQRRPWTYLCFETMEGFLPPRLRRLYARPGIPPWFTCEFANLQAEVFWSDTQRTSIFGIRPSFHGAVAGVDHLRRQLSRFHLNALANHRPSYPYLDRDLLTFLIAIPREQLVRPGQRRSLMRRALAELVPPEIFARRRKAFVSRRPLARINSAMPNIQQLLHSPIIVSSGWMDPVALASNLRAAQNGAPEQMIPLIKTIELELWLRSVIHDRQIANLRSHHNGGSTELRLGTAAEGTLSEIRRG
jgi:asparagine synthase (glutamine-hydrolysing)